MLGLSLSNVIGRSGSKESFDPVPGQTLFWRENFNHVDVGETINSGNPRGFDSVSGSNAFARLLGPRSATALTQPGHSLRIPYEGDGDKFTGTVNLSGAVRTCGMVCGYLNLYHCSINPVRILTVVGTDGDPTAPSAAVIAKLNTFGGQALSFTMWNSVDGIGTWRSAGYLGQWIYVTVVWEWANPTFRFRAYCKLSTDSAPVLLDEVSYSGDLSPVSVRLRSHSTEWYGGSYWSGAFGGMSIYALDSIDTAAILPTDVKAPSYSRPNWYVGPNGNDSNSGYGSSSNAWQTWSKLVAEFNNGTLLSDYRRWSGGNIEDITTIEQSNAWDDAYLNGERTLSGAILWIDSTAAAPLNIGIESDAFPTHNIHGLTIRGTSPEATITNRFDLSGVTWTQPDDSGHPTVWKYSASGFDYSVPWTNDVVHTPVTAADEATALPLLSGGLLRCWADSTGVYISSDTNPNSDGKTRYCGMYSDVSATFAGVISTDNTLVKNLVIQIDPLYAYSVGSGYINYCLDGAFTGITVLDNVVIDGGSYHGIGQLADALQSKMFRHNVTWKRGGMLGGYSSDVIYTDDVTSDLGDIFATWRSCTAEDAFVYAGQEAANSNQGDFLFAHGIAPRSTPAFKQIEMRDSDTWGQINPQITGTNGEVYEGCTISRLVLDSEGAVANNCTFRTTQIKVYPGQGSGSLTLNNPNISDSGETWSVPAYLGASLTINDGILDLSNYNFAANGSAVWSHQNPLTLHINRTRIITNGDSAVLLINGDSGDDILVDECVFVGHENPFVFLNYDDGGGDDQYTFNDAVAAGLITNSVAVAYPVAEFSADDTSVNEGVEVAFTDESTGTPTSWLWNFGDGSTSTLQNPTHTYTVAGTYTVSLTVENLAGSDSEVKTNYITVTVPGSTPANAMVTPTGDYLVTPNGDYLVHP